jgi:hypothetical protein
MFSDYPEKVVSMATPTPTTISTEPIGSIPRPIDLTEQVAKADSEDPDLVRLYEDAIRDTIRHFEETGSPVITDGEQRKCQNFVTYCVHGLPNTAPDGFKILFSGGPYAHCSSRPHIETLEEVRDRSFEPGKNWRWCGEAVNF